MLMYLLCTLQHGVVFQVWTRWHTTPPSSQWITTTSGSESALPRWHATWSPSRAWTSKTPFGCGSCLTCNASPPKGSWQGNINRPRGTLPPVLATRRARRPPPTPPLTPRVRLAPRQAGLPPLQPRRWRRWRPCPVVIISRTINHHINTPTHHLHLLTPTTTPSATRVTRTPKWNPTGPGEVLRLPIEASIPMTLGCDQTKSLVSKSSCT